MMPYHGACALLEVNVPFHILQPSSISVRFSSLFAICLAHLIHSWSVMFLHIGPSLSLTLT